MPSVELLRGKSGSIGVGCQCSPDCGVRVEAASSSGHENGGSTDLRAYLPPCGSLTRAGLLNDFGIRAQGENLAISIEGEGVSDAIVYVVTRSGRPSAHLTVNVAGDLSGLAHPLAKVLPHLDGGGLYVQTEWRDGARFAFLDPNLAGPTI